VQARRQDGRARRRAAGIECYGDLRDVYQGRLSKQKALKKTPHRARRRCDGALYFFSQPEIISGISIGRHLLLAKEAFASILRDTSFSI
jgi:hypothetical protein